MLTLGVGTGVMLMIIIGAVCALGGYAFAQASQRRAGGGKSAQELHRELGDYKENVTEHFQTTATLLQEMTEQYRSVYEHMASGAENLCDPESATEQIENLRAGLLPATIVAPIASASAIDELTDNLASPEDADVAVSATPQTEGNDEIGGTQSAEATRQAELDVDNNEVDATATERDSDTSTPVTADLDEPDAIGNDASDVETMSRAEIENPATDSSELQNPNKS